MPVKPHCIEPRYGRCHESIARVQAQHKLWNPKFIMNKSFKPVLNRSTGTYVAASENVKSSGKPAKSKLAMKVASASLALSASVAMLSSGHAVADESVPANEYLTTISDDASGSYLNSEDAATVQTDEGASVPAGVQPGTKLLGSSMLGSQLLGATPTGVSVLYDDSTNNSITFTGTAGTKLSNVAAGIATNTSDIAQNTSDIATNTSNISTLNTQIADAVKYDGTAHDTITLERFAIVRRAAKYQ
ncbi:ESPR domain-containing protein [Caballeronia sp. DA-9]|uniref:ESPR domain-containing protein n=1 Tax=Caballeronia sp. DA-9 TaxID=3436237 RepID=UPI003F6813D3